MPKRFVFLGMSFLIISVLAGVFGIIYFGGNNNDNTEEASSTDIPLPSATATLVTVDNNSSADLITPEPPTVPTDAVTEVVATPLNMRTATSIAYQTQIPFTLTALYESQTGTRTALELMATGTAEANATSITSTENP